MSELEEAFFKDLTEHLILWRDSLVDAVRDPESAYWSENRRAAADLNAKGLSNDELESLRTLTNECLRGLIHSVLVTIDGGTAMTDVGSVILADASNATPLTSGALHEDFAQYLAEHALL